MPQNGRLRRDRTGGGLRSAARPLIEREQLVSAAVRWPGRSTGSYGEISVADRSGSGPFSRLGASLVLTAANLFLRGWGLAKMPHVPVIAQKNRLQALGALCPCQPRHIRRLWMLVFDKKSQPVVDCTGEVITFVAIEIAGVCAGDLAKDRNILAMIGSLCCAASIREPPSLHLLMPR